MRPILVLLIFYLATCSCALCQDLTGNWTGRITQSNIPNVFITMEISIKQVGNNLTGQTKVNSSEFGYVIEKFRGTFINSKVTLNEYEVVKQYSTRSFLWALKICEGLLETNVSENKRVIEGTWNCTRVFNNSTSNYENYDCGSGGTFTVSQSLPQTPQIQPPNIESTISGQVIDKETLEGVKSTLTIVSESTPKKTESTLEDGKYSFPTTPNTNYTILVNATNYEPLKESVSSGSTKVIKNFLLVQKQKITQPGTTFPAKSKDNEAILLKNVLFKANTDTLLPESFGSLNNLATEMKANPQLKIRLEGHTARYPNSSPQANLDLSIKRVAKVKEYLIDRGIMSDRVETIGYGDTKLIDQPMSVKNMRVEFVILNQ